MVNLRRVILGTVLGALAAFAWAYVSWSAVRLYDWALEPLPADSALVDAIGRGAPRDGAYGFPGIDMQALNAMEMFFSVHSNKAVKTEALTFFRAVNRPVIF